MLTGSAIAGGWNGELDWNVGYNDNVYLESDSLLSVVNSEQSLSNDTQQQLMLSADYEVLDSENSDTKLFVDYFYEQLFSSDIDSTVASVAVPWTYYTDLYRFKLSPVISRFQANGEDVLQSRRLGIDVARKVGRLNLGVNYTFTRRQALDVSYEPYQGLTRDGRLYLIAWWPGHSLGMNVGAYSNDYEVVDDLSEGYGGQFVNVSYRWYHAKFSLDLYAQLKTRNYVDDRLYGTARNDVSRTLLVVPSYRISKRLSTYISIEMNQNDSSVDNVLDEFNELRDYNYQQLISSIGLMWRL